MKILKTGALVLLAIALAAPALQAGPRFELKLRVYEGSRETELTPPVFVTSSYIQPTITANLHTEFDLEKETAQVKRVFNLKDLRLLTEAVLTAGGEGSGSPSDTARHIFRLNGNAFEIDVRLIEVKPAGRFVVVFNEIGGEKRVNILTTEMLLVGGHTAVLGFEDRKGAPYFCSFHLSGPPEALAAAPPPPPPPPPPPAELKEFEQGAIKASGDIKPPRLVKSVNPVYPDEAKEKKLEGIVVLNVRIDTRGKVSKVMVLKSKHEILSDAAMEAIKQWQWEPIIVDGKPRDTVLTVTVRFTLDPNPPKPPPPPKPPKPPEEF